MLYYNQRAGKRLPIINSDGGSGTRDWVLDLPRSNIYLKVFIQKYLIIIFSSEILVGSIHYIG